MTDLPRTPPFRQMQAEALLSLIFPNKLPAAPVGIITKAAAHAIGQLFLMEDREVVEKVFEPLFLPVVEARQAQERALPS